MDWKDPHGSPIFSPDPEIGFGSHGTEVVNEIGVPSYKVDNGAFAGLRVSVSISTNSMLDDIRRWLYQYLIISCEILVYGRI